MSCFYFLAILNDAAMTTLVQVAVWTYVSTPLGYTSREGIAGSSSLTFCVTTKLFSKMDPHFTSPPPTHEGSSSSRSSRTHGTACRFGYGRPGLNVTSLGGLGLCLVMPDEAEHLITCSLAFSMSSLEKSLSESFAHILIGLSFYCQAVRVFYVF